jgi:carboxypeptidase C (cathepsin A)
LSLVISEALNLSVVSRIPRILIVTALAGTMTMPSPAQAPEGQKRGTGDTTTQKEEQSVPVPPETSSVTKHDWTAGGRTVHYTATAGNLLIRDDQDKANGSIFYSAYTEDGVEAKTRPVTFFYNGGPGAATVWLHMGSFGPVRVINRIRRLRRRRHSNGCKINTA